MPNERASVDSGLVNVDIRQSPQRATIERLLAETASDQPGALQSFLLVGAVGDQNDPSNPLSPEDTRHLLTFLAASVDMGLPIHPQTSFTRADLRDGADFLDISKSYDAVLFCYIFHNPTGALTPGDNIYLQSDKHDDEALWHDKLVGMDAKLVGNVQDQSEFALPNPWLAKPPFVQLGSKPVVQMPDRQLTVFLNRDWSIGSP